MNTEKIKKGISFLFSQGPVKTGRKIRREFDKKALERRLIREAFAPISGEERKAAEAIADTARFSILVPLYNTPETLLREMIQSVREQTYPSWELCLADGSDGKHPEVGRICREMAEQDSRIRYRKLEENNGISENTNACMEMATGDYIALLDHDDLLLPSALYENARVIREQGADFIYSDEAVFYSPDRTNWMTTHLKPDFAPENLLSNNYICHLSVFRASLLEKAGKFRKEYDGSQDHDLILRLTGCAEKVAHIPKVLYLWRNHATSTASDISTKTYAVTAGQNAVKDYLRTQRGMEATVESAPEYPTLYHVRFPVPGNPSVNLILDAAGYDIRKALKEIARLKEKTSRENIRFTMITEEEVLDGEKNQDSEITFLSIREGNRAVRLNRAVKETAGEYLLFLAMDLEPVQPDWMEELLMLARQEEIGAVGGKLYFRNNTLRHGGIVMGLGRNHLAGRIHYQVERGCDGYSGWLAVAENVSAVSGECLMIRRERFEEAGGFDGNFRDTLYDVDLCLRLLDRGYRNVYTPFAELRGGSSGKYPMDYGSEFPHYAEDAETLRKKHTGRLGCPDPYYNPNLIPEE